MPQFTLSTLFSWNQVTVVIEASHVEWHMSSWAERDDGIFSFSFKSPHTDRERNEETEQLTSLASPSLLIQIVSHSWGPWPCALARSSFLKIFFYSIRSKRSEKRNWVCSAEVRTSFSKVGETVLERWRISFESCRCWSVGLRKRPTKSNSIEKKKCSFGRCLAGWRGR